MWDCSERRCWPEQSRLEEGASVSGTSVITKLFTCIFRGETMQGPWDYESGSGFKHDVTASPEGRGRARSALGGAGPPSTGLCAPAHGSHPRKPGAPLTTQPCPLVLELRTYVCAISHSLPPPKTSCPHILGARTRSRIKWWSVTCCAGVTGKLGTFAPLTAPMMSCRQHRVLHSHSL